MCFTSGLGLERRGKEEGSSMLFREIFLSLSQQTKERQAKRDNSLRVFIAGSCSPDNRPRGTLEIEKV